MATQICLNDVRFSYVNIFDPRPGNSGGDAKYSVTLLIPKEDPFGNLPKIKAAMAEARANFCRKNGESALPAKPVSTLHDGDGLKENGDPYGEECKGHYVMTVSSRLDNPPKVLDLNKKPITDRSVLYSGCYGQAVVNFYGYNANGRKGISAGLQGLRKMRDGDPLGGGVGCRESDFDDVKVPGAEDDDSWML